MTAPFIEENDQTTARREHLEALRALIGNVYPNKFARSNVTDTPAGEDTITSIVAVFKHFEPKVPEGQKPTAEILETTTGMKEVLGRSIKQVPALRGKTVVNMFFEDSTRTRISFELAAKALSATPRRAGSI